MNKHIAASPTGSPQPDNRTTPGGDQLETTSQAKSVLQPRYPLSAITRRLWLALACVLALAAGFNGAAAEEQVPYQDAYALHFVNGINNGDGTSDEVYAGKGIATHVGQITVVMQLHVGVVQYDSANTFAFRTVSGTATVTAANGDKLFSRFTVLEVAPLPLSPPFHFAGTQQILGGTGRFEGAKGRLTLSGLDYHNGIVSFTSTGIISMEESNE
jgi:hypothetical protein